MQTLAAAHGRDAAYWGDRPDWLIAAAMHRDSDVLTRSNFRTMQTMLEKLGADDVDTEESSHFLVGWVRYLVVRPGTAAEAEADRLRAKLDDYPVLDEEDWSELESDAAQECWASLPLRDRIDYCKRFDVSIFAARHQYVPDSPTGELVSVLAE